MKHLKLFEKYFENDWESWIDNIPDEKLGNYYKHNEPIQHGQRVYHQKGGYGTFMGMYKGEAYVCFDKKTFGNYGTPNDELEIQYNCRHGYGWLVKKINLRKIIP